MHLSIRKLLKISPILVSVSALSVAVAYSDTFAVSVEKHLFTYEQPVEISVSQQDTNSRYPIPKNGKTKSPLHLKTPSNITTEVEYNPKTNDYVVLTKIGDVVLDRQYMTFKEYQDWQMENLMETYGANKNQTESLNNSA